VTAVASLGAAAVRAIEHSDRLVMSSEGVGSTVTTFRLSGRVPALRLVLRAGDRVVAQGMLEGLTLE
jgi:hypothetical protein